MSKKQAIAIRHLAFEDLGNLETVLGEEGYEVSYLEAGRDDLSAVAKKDPDVLVVLGGPISANQTETFSFLNTELSILQDRLQRQRPTIGICLGAQLMAKSLGYKVFKGKAPEICWSPVNLTSDGQNSVLSALSDNQLRVLHWHGETFDLPKEAKLLCSTDICTNQAFSIGNHALALQFHLEVELKSVERWFIGHICEIEHTPSISVADLRAQSHEYAERLNKSAQNIWRNWLRAAG